MSEPVQGSGADGGAPTRGGVVPPTPRPVPGPRAVPGPPSAGPATPAPAPRAPAPPGPSAAPDGPGEDGAVTGDAAVDEAMRTLQGVEDRELRAQVTVFEDVHRALQDRLADAEG
ncbi:hypothetical protein Cfla_1656 [Cellulomonas flavigena DSM 20109]|uniref:Uncharacterized protein n=1 Tax=Cellulomonas flavigena (strain ATCC 482 / DSM 20109 / BCRC 11376 / JCM 18109 / NBRC 3775 / NCIMB 8073 / NRS 134) TaxID=446466 RepID=D5UDZ5_CELFN|nr:hypothetical protein [Cellulomonas flavigena]ADG74553.1 hypothetical protein Cfla_1656 [Cellulomonas flavigena DSM 20109]